MKKIEQLDFNNTYSRLPSAFFSSVAPTPLKKPVMASVNPVVASLLGLDDDHLKTPESLQILSGQRLAGGMQPLAQCYAGHQFGHLVPRLGDGRAILLGEIETRQQGKWDLQLKGSGLTPYSRDGDGRAVLRSTIREYLCSSAMHGLGIPSTLALCMIDSDEEVYREQIERGALLLRTAPSHIRFGTFEYFYYSQQHDHIEVLLSYLAEHYYPELQTVENPALQLLTTVIDRTASLIAHWQSVGFAHGVMNTDNMSILGLTLDYGPYGFLDAYDPGFICNHSDYHGRYAFNQQPETGLFNLGCLAQALLPAMPGPVETAVNAAKQALENYGARYAHHYARLMRAKLGLKTQHADDQALLDELLNLLANDHVDYSLFFRQLCYFSVDELGNHSQLVDLFIQPEPIIAWLERYRQRLRNEHSVDEVRRHAMLKTNPKYILRNYMAEMAIRKAEDERDYSAIDMFLNLLQSPFDEHPESENYAAPPPDWARQISVSCSS